MSWQAVRAVFESSQSKGAARLVLLAIADRSDERGQGAFLSSVQLQAAANVDDRTVRRVLRELEALGELEIVGRARNGANNFAITLAGQTPGILPGGYIARGQDARGDRALRPGGAGNMPPLTKRSQNDPEQTKIRDHAVAPAQPVENVTPMLGVLRALARSILLENPAHWLGPGYGDWANEIKARAAKMRLATDDFGQLVRQAQDGAEHQVRREQSEGLQAAAS